MPTILLFAAANLSMATAWCWRLRTRSGALPPRALFPAGLAVALRQRRLPTA